jgi:ArsR family transcriptional regulator
MNRYSYERGEIVTSQNEVERCNCKDTQGSEQCECIIEHEDVIDKVKENLPPEASLMDLAEFFKIFGDTTRIRILYVLFQSEMCVCDIANILNMTQSAISHQLRTLKQMQLVKFRRQGKTVYYSLSDGHIKTIINQGMEHICE